MKHLLWLAMLLVCGWAAPGSAEDRFPTRPIKIIVPTAAGGVTDRRSGGSRRVSRGSSASQS